MKRKPTAADLEEVNQALTASIIEELKAKGTYSDNVLPLVEAYVRAVAEYRRISAEIDKGIRAAVEDERGTQRLNPLYRLQRNFFEQMGKGAKALGISPEFKVRWVGKLPENLSDRKTITHLIRKPTKTGTD